MFSFNLLTTMRTEPSFVLYDGPVGSSFTMETPYNGHNLLTKLSTRAKSVLDGVSVKKIQNFLNNQLQNMCDLDHEVLDHNVELLNQMVLHMKKCSKKGSSVPECIG
jgi:hypothetical protein